MAGIKYTKQYPDSDAFITSLGRVQVTLNALHDYRDCLQIAYEELVHARTARMYMADHPKAKEKCTTEWDYSMRRVRSKICDAKAKKATFIAHLNSTHESPAIHPDVYFDIGAIRTNYPYKGGAK